MSNIILKKLTERLNNIINDWNILVLKKFPINIIPQIQYPCLDDFAISNYKIDLNKLTYWDLLKSLEDYTGKKQGLLTFEAFLWLYNRMGQKEFCKTIKSKIIIIENNLLDNYDNPTTINVPDFDFDFNHIPHSVECDTFDNIYSNCTSQDGHQYVEYVEPNLTNSEIKTFLLFEPVQFKFTPSTINDQTIEISEELASEYKERIYNNTPFQYHNFTISNDIECNPVKLKKIQILYACARYADIPISFTKTRKTINTYFREELHSLLNQIWGYNDFRLLTVYDENDISTNRSVIEMSQGSIIETVIQQAESGLKNNSGTRDILLTAPTGSGKSILFQLSAIYLARKYEAITIVISPLIALMKDQVANLKRLYPKVAYINSELSPMEKEERIKGIKEGKFNIVYMAPELLMCYQLEYFIGSRKLGLLVIDEAHTVTTWGRDFRVDYWFLGNYLRRIKKDTRTNFPIFALTATMVYDITRENDMLLETIESLHMKETICYIGVVKRNNISFDIQPVEYNTNIYTREKNKKTLERVEQFAHKHRKVIIYFPWTRTLEDIYGKLPTHLRRITRKYHGDMGKADKQEAAREFSEDSINIMLATKAFGMGIDISNIDTVYHYAPSGNLSDYVQEIGRLARNPQITGIAKIDYNTKDLHFYKTLYGLSSIKLYQLKMVLHKLVNLYHAKGEHRNMLVYVDDFQYIFPGKNIDYNQKVQSSLMLLETDLQKKHNYPALIIRPKSLFSIAFYKIKEGDIDSLVFNNEKYITKLDGNKISLKISELWEDKFRDQSFAMFKKEMSENNIFQNYKFETIFQLTLKLGNMPDIVLDKLINFTKRVEQALSEITGFVPVKKFISNLGLPYAHEVILNSIKTIYESQLQFRSDDEEEDMQIQKTSYTSVSSGLRQTFNRFIIQKEDTYYIDERSNMIKLARIIELLGLGNYQLAGGKDPAIFIRINHPAELEYYVRKNNYTNSILENIHHKYNLSVNIFEYFFKTKLTDKQRWDFIEDYFLGAKEEELFEKYK